jgi:hypothetical protein
MLLPDLLNSVRDYGTKFVHISNVNPVHVKDGGAMRVNEIKKASHLMAHLLRLLILLPIGGVSLVLLWMISWMPPLFSPRRAGHLALAG